MNALVGSASRLASRQAVFWDLVTGNAPLRNPGGIFASSETLSAERRLHVYRSMYRTRIGELLRSTFPSVEGALGLQDFRVLALSYLEHSPSRDQRLEFAGRGLPEFLYHHRRPEWREQAWAAALDWARWAAPLAPDPEAILTPETLDTASLASSCLRLIPSLELAYEPAKRARAVWYDSGRLLECALDTCEAAALKDARDGAPFPALCLQFARSRDSVARVATTLRAWLGRRWIADLEPWEELSP